MSTQLTYRGTAYQVQPQAVDTVESKQLAQYRGLRYTIRRPVNVSQPKSQVLKYRGVAYNTGNVTIPTSQPSQIPAGMVPAFN